MKRSSREYWAMLLVLLHLIVVPCATTMQLMPADSQCEHCQTLSGPEACVAASAATDSVIEGVAFDSGPAAQPGLLLAEAPSNSSSVVQTFNFCPRSFPARHSGDQPLYLLLGQLRI